MLRAIILICVVTSVAFGDELGLPVDLNTATLGVSVVAIADATPDPVLPFPTRRGVLLTVVDDFGPCGKIGMQSGAIVTAVDGKEIQDSADFQAAVARGKAGESMTISGFNKPKDQDGAVSWKHHSVKVTPQTTREFVLGSLVKRRDEANEVTVYRHNWSPVTQSPHEGISAYILRYDDNGMSLRMRVQHAPPANQRDRLMKVVSVRIGDDRLRFPAFDQSTVRKDNVDDVRMEWVDARAEDGHLRMLTRIAAASNVEFKIDEYAMGWARVSPQQLHALRIILQAHAIFQRDQINPRI